ncbi:hypothetical protein [Anaerosalibacter sp. Marseille-P3206]|uniref:hypothetical protein n=1 Tax=Anaerosalibacter sp. Marseille-P3206 TaxID=1871005 RepID=UPI0009874382|nr:hypothetical protein [Anaerosalibacter sp. Marseille-P3206]
MEKNSFEDIKLYEDLILTELLNGKTKEEIAATLQGSSRIDYDEHFILRSLAEGKTREEIAKILKHKSFRTLDMFMRRRGYKWDSEKQNYILESQKTNDDYDSISSSKVQQIIDLFKAKIDPKEIAKRVGMTDHMAIAQYMKDKGYAWSPEEQNYTLIKGEIPQTNTVSINNNTPENVNIEYETEPTTYLSKLDRLEKLIPLLETIDKNKERILDLLVINDEGTIPRYVVGGITITKSICMSHRLANLVKEFSIEKNISQKEIFEIAIIEFLKKYGYESEINALFF